MLPSLGEYITNKTFSYKPWFRSATPGVRYSGGSLFRVLFLLRRTRNEEEEEKEEEPIEIPPPQTPVYNRTHADQLKVHRFDTTVPGTIHSSEKSRIRGGASVGTMHRRHRGRPEFHRSYKRAIARSCSLEALELKLGQNPWPEAPPKRHQDLNAHASQP